MADRHFNVLILCTGNSARSIIAEALLNDLNGKAGAGIRAYSAGSSPKGEVHPMALEVLADNGVATADLHSKSWDEFALPTAPAMDIVITVCDSAAGETCPVWPGSPARVHWGLPDPAGIIGSRDAVRSAFQATFAELFGIMKLLIAKLEPGMDRKAVQACLRQIRSGEA